MIIVDTLVFLRDYIRVNMADEYADYKMQVLSIRDLNQAKENVETALTDFEIKFTKEDLIILSNTLGNLFIWSEDNRSFRIDKNVLKDVPELDADDILEDQLAIYRMCLSDSYNKNSMYATVTNTTVNEIENNHAVAITIIDKTREAIAKGELDKMSTYPDYKKWHNHSYCSGILDGNNPTIIIGYYEDPKKRLFSFYHELGHLCNSDPEAMSSYEQEEYAWSAAIKFMDRNHFLVDGDLTYWKDQQLKTYHTPEHMSHSTNLPYCTRGYTIHYTPEEIRERLSKDKKICICPYCGSESVSVRPMIIDPSQFEQITTICHKCHKVGYNYINVYKETDK